MIARALTGTLVALLLLGCSAREDSGPAPSPTPSAAPAYTVDQLREAVPPVEDIDGAKEMVSSCPGDDNCGVGDGANVQLEMPASLTSGEVKERYDAFVLAEDMRVQANPVKDAAAAIRDLAGSRREAEAFVGKFHTDGEFSDDRSSYTFGFDGTGTLEDIDLGGWSGFVSRRDEVFTNPDGEDDSAPMALTELHLVSGPNVLLVTARTLGDESGRARADTLALKLAEQYLTRLERLG